MGITLRLFPLTFSLVPQPWRHSRRSGILLGNSEKVADVGPQKDLCVNEREVGMHSDDYLYRPLEILSSHGRYSF